MDSGEHRAEVDVLHPLATLHWEHCHKWRESLVWPTHCVVLHDIVAVLDMGLYRGDKLHISSNNLHSWTTTHLPYCYMSLTTYQDKLVAVGGRDPSTIGEVTDQVLTSATGEDWQPSLPPMPTKRYYTSSVSAGSPEVIIVAGGMGSDDRALHTVEVLLGDQWSTAHPLPTPCYEMRSSLHKGNFYFTGGRDQENTIYTCSCTPLIASCGLTGNDTSTTTPVWSKLEAPHNTRAIVSYSSRLITVDRRCDIRGYFSMRQSWVETTSEGERRDGNFFYDPLFKVAAVLPTGQLVVAHIKGVYRVKLSVATFDPDSKFISNVLSRLEAVMGVHIVSVLANIRYQLTTTSGVPQFGKRGRRAPGQYVEEVISRWSAGRSPRPPTWRELLQVLQDIGQLELRQQIEVFMKCPYPWATAPLMLCLQQMTKKETVVLNDCHKVWFCQPCSHLSGTYDTKDSPSSSERVLENLEHSPMMSVYADLVGTVKSCVLSVADRCLSVGLISKDAYDTIIQRRDLIDSDKARILLSHIGDAVSQKPESLQCFITVLNDVGGCEELVHKLQNVSS